MVFEMKVRMVCDNCGSEDVLRDAFAKWDYDSQEWIFNSTLDTTSCNTCGEEDCVEEKAVS